MEMVLLSLDSFCIRVQSLVVAAHDQQIGGPVPVGAEVVHDFPDQCAADAPAGDENGLAIGLDIEFFPEGGLMVLLKILPFGQRPQDDTAQSIAPHGMRFSRITEHGSASGMQYMVVPIAQDKGPLPEPFHGGRERKGEVGPGEIKGLERIGRFFEIAKMNRIGIDQIVIKGDIRERDVQRYFPAVRIGTQQRREMGYFSR